MFPDIGMAFIVLKT